MPLLAPRRGTPVCALLLSLGIALPAVGVEVMGSETLSEDVTDGVTVVSGTAGDVLTIQSGVSVTSDDPFVAAVTVDAADYTVANEGDVGLFEVIGVQFDQGGGTLTNDGVISSGLLNAVSFLADGTVENNGNISGGAGVSFAGQGTLTNSGQIDSGVRAVELQDGGTVINETDAVLRATNATNGQALVARPTSNAVDVTNRGTIANAASTAAAVELRSSSANTFDNQGDVMAAFDAVVIGGPATATNAGSIESTGGRGVVLEGSGSFGNEGSVTATAVGVQVDASAAVTNRPTGSITSSGAEGVRIDGGGSLLNQGSIAGATDAVRVTGAGDVTNQGTLAGGSGAAVAFSGVAANTFTHSGSASTSGAGAAVLMGGGDDLVVLQTGATLSADIDGGDGSDTLRLEGSGSFDQGLLSVESLVVDASDWSLTGAIPPIDARIDAGRLRVSGSLAGTLAVNAAGTLLGGGSVGDLTNRGRVAPGDSIGTLSAASYVQEAGGELAIEISSASADRLAVSGDVDLQGGTLAITPVGTFLGAGPFDILTAGGSLGPGQFATISSSPLFTTDVQYTPGPGGRVSLELQLTGSFASFAATPNQAAVATAVDQVFPTASGDLAVVLGGLLALPDEPSLQAGLDQLSPEPLGATAEVVFTQARWHAALLTDHLRDLRLSATPTGGGGAAPGAALAVASLPEAREPGARSLRANAWGVYSDLEGGSRHTGYDAFGGLFGLGAETWQSERLLLGADLSGGYTRIDSERDGSAIDGVHGRLTGFGSLDLGRAYLDALGAYAYHWFDADRRIRYDGIDRDARSDHGAHELGAYLGTGLELSHAGFDFGPEASGHYLVLFEEDYREGSAGAAGLRIDDRDPDSLVTRLGVRVSRRWRIDPETVIVPRLRLGWSHEWLDTSHDLSASFASPGAPPFEVSSRSLGRDSLVARVGVRALLGDDIVVEGDYGLDVGRSESMSHQLGLVLRAAF